MNTSRYSEKAINQFVFNNVCQKDKLLRQYLQNGNVTKFQKRLSTFKDSDKKIEKAVVAIFTNTLYDVILREISLLSKKMEPLGFLIVGGGAAINKYLPYDQKDVVSDIDTKFVPSVKGITSRSPKYFGYLQMAKLLMWKNLGMACKRLSAGPILDKALRQIKTTPVGKCLGIYGKGTFKRRYTLIPKFKHSKTSRVTSGNVLMDVEVMAIDMDGIGWFHPSQGKTKRNLGGLLDIAYMRKGEMGARVLHKTTKGLGKFKSILVSGKKFLLDDIYLLKTLKLRPEKLNKNKERLVKFAKYVYDVDFKNNSKQNKVFKSIVNTNKNTPLTQKKPLTQKFINTISKINPQAYEKFTTPLSWNKIKRYSYAPYVHNQEYRFNNIQKKWVMNNKNSYIHEKWNVRNNKAILYGFNPKRNKWVPGKIIEKSKSIPLVAFKDKMP
tara:strand:+ start:885 stop:2201 length:1317 start_codon:yes stop_codon:yes gene_type:complete